MLFALLARARGRGTIVGKPKMDGLDVDEIVAEALMFLGGQCGVWSSFLSHMKEVGWSEKNVDQAWLEFGRRVGRDL